jgi:hypothetical protein
MPQPRDVLGSFGLGLARKLNMGSARFIVSLILLSLELCSAMNCREYLEILTGEKRIARNQRIEDRSVNLYSSRGRDLTVNFLEARAHQLGYSTERQEWMRHFRRGKEKIKLTNLVVSIPGENLNGPTLLVGAHYDSVNSESKAWRDYHPPYRATPGADDNASGVTGAALLLEKFKGLKPKWNIQVVYFDAEEPGLVGVYVGSRHFVSKLPKNGNAFQIKLAIILDMIGRPGANTPLVYGVSSFQMPRSILEAALFPASGEKPLVARIQEPHETDYIDLADNRNFTAAGIPSLLFCDVVSLHDLPDHYHRDIDQAKFIDEEYHRAVVNQVERLIKKVAF